MTFDRLNFAHKRVSIMHVDLLSTPFHHEMSFMLHNVRSFDYLLHLLTLFMDVALGFILDSYIECQGIT